MSRFIVVSFAGALAGCAGLYGEVAVTKVPSMKLTPNAGGDGVDVGGGTTVGFNIGVDFGNTRQRFAMGGGAANTSFDGGDSSFQGATLRYDRSIINLAERAELRVGVGSETGNATGTSGGMETQGIGLGVFGGVGATFYPTWHTPVHLLVGAEWMTAEAGDDMNVRGVGITARLAVGITTNDARPDQTFVVPLEKNRDITGLISMGGAAIGCSVEDESRSSYMAKVTLKCDGKRIEYFQIAEGILITCKHESSRSRCEALNKRIVAAAGKG
jgi:hypothetical protein